MADFWSEAVRRFALQKEYGGTAKPVNASNPLVSVTIAAYQQQSYVRQSLDGALMQLCSFPYEIIVGEDGSTDGTREICVDYANRSPDRVRLFLRDRQQSHYCDDVGRALGRFNGLWTRMSARGKYIAWCDGDDYWTDPLKLQKQVDFLEAHSEHGVVFTDADHLYQATGQLIRSYNRARGISVPSGHVLDSLLLGRCPYRTVTAMFRTCYLTEYEMIARSHPSLVMDRSLWLLISGRSNVGYLPESTAVYREVARSVSHHLTLTEHMRFARKVHKITLFFAAYFNRRIDRNRLRKAMFVRSLMYCAQCGSYRTLFEHAGCFPLALYIVLREGARRIFVWMRSCK